MAFMSMSSFVEAELGAGRVALPLHQVQRIVRAAALHAVPGARSCLLGALDLAGQLVSVYDARRLLGLPTRPMRASDRIVITSAPQRCALLVDDVIGTVEASRLPDPQSFAMHAAGVGAAVRSVGGLLLVQDLRRLLAFECAIPIAGHA
jgi:purine-binding chemotaxis protein CheW